MTVLRLFFCCFHSVCFKYASPCMWKQSRSCNNFFLDKPVMACSAQMFRISGKTANRSRRTTDESQSVHRAAARTFLSFYKKISSCCTCPQKPPVSQNILLRKYVRHIGELGTSWTIWRRPLDPETIPLQSSSSFLFVTAAQSSNHTHTHTQILLSHYYHVGGIKILQHIVVI